jgi:hypothetical protein
MTPVLLRKEPELRADSSLIRSLIVNDAIDTGTVVRELTYLRQRRVALYRPLVGLQVLERDSSVPAWAESIEDQIIAGFGERARPAGQPGAGRRGTVPSVKKETKTYKQFTFVTGYSVLDSDLERAQATGINVRDSVIATNLRLYEEHLDQIVAIGDTGEASEYEIPGLCNCADVVGENSQVYLDPVSKVPSGTAAYLWAIPANSSTLAANEAAVTSMVNGMIADIAKIIDQIRTQGKQRYQCNTILLPLSYYSAASRLIQPHTSQTALELLRKAFPEITRWFPWYRLETASHTSGPRIVGFDSSAPEVARLSISRELYDDQPQRLSEGFGIYVPQAYTIAGVLIQVPAGIAYLDSVPHS